MENTQNFDGIYVKFAYHNLSFAYPNLSFAYLNLSFVKFAQIKHGKTINLHVFSWEGMSYSW